MWTIGNRELRVQLLDPKEDRERLGTRYCHGGYVWQVEDAVAGPLLSGPCFPEEPDVFNGQGLPEIFTPVWGEDEVEQGGRVGLPGIGEVEFTTGVRPFDRAMNTRILVPCDWAVRVTGTVATYETRQALGAFGAHLVRTVSLEGRLLQMRTRLVNSGSVGMPVRWFAHPFFPMTRSGRATQFGAGVSVPSHPAYGLEPDGALRLVPGSPSTICYHVLRVEPGTRLRAMQAHDAVGSIEVSGDFPLALLPVWYNESAYSFEPYFETLLAPGQGADWGLRYRFG